MKKIVFTMCALALSICGFAQKKNVNAADAKLYDPVDLPGAKSLIEAAMQDPTTSQQAKTYSVAAEVYYRIYDQQDSERKLNHDYSQATINEALLKGVEAYKKLAELDVLPNEKGQVKPKYMKSLPSKLEKQINSLNLEGYYCYNDKKYEEAVDLWNKSIEIQDMEVMSKNKVDSLYLETKNNIVIAANKVDSRQSLAIKYMEDLKKEPKYSISMYEWLYLTYQKLGNDDKMVSTLKEGVEKHPSHKFFIDCLINYYISNNKTDEILSYADVAISKDPKNPQYYLIKSKVYLKKDEFQNAVDECKKAIAIDANDFDSNFLCGFAYVKMAEGTFDKASKIKDNNKYKTAKNLAIDQFREAIPYLEKARTIDPKELNNLNLLKTSYYRVGNGAKYSEIDAEMKKLQ